MCEKTAFLRGSAQHLLGEGGQEAHFRMAGSRHL